MARYEVPEYHETAALQSRCITKPLYHKATVPRNRHRAAVPQSRCCTQVAVPRSCTAKNCCAKSRKVSYQEAAVLQSRCATKPLYHEAVKCRTTKPPHHKAAVPQSRCTTKPLHHEAAPQSRCSTRTAEPKTAVHPSRCTTKPLLHQSFCTTKVAPPQPGGSHCSQAVGEGASTPGWS